MLLRLTASLFVAKTNPSMEESVPVIKDMKETKAAIVSILSPAHKTPTELAMLASVNMDIGDKEISVLRKQLNLLANPIALETQLECASAILTTSEMHKDNAYYQAGAEQTK